MARGLFLMLLMCSCHASGVVSRDAGRDAAVADVKPHYGGAPTRPPLGDAGVPASWQVPAWYVGPTGSDGASCQSAGSPCLHYSEIAARWGSRPQLSQYTTITWTGDSPVEPVNIDVEVLPGAGILIGGTPIQIASGTLGTITAKNRATAQRWQADLQQSMGSWIGYMLYDTTQNAWAWIDSQVGSSTVAVLTQPEAPVFASNYAWQTPGNWTAYPNPVSTIAAGDSYQIWRPTKVNIESYNVQATGTRLTASPPVYPPIWLANLWLIDPQGVGKSFVRMPGTMKCFAHWRSDRMLMLGSNEAMEEPTPSTNSWLPGGYLAVAGLGTDWVLYGGAIGSTVPGASTGLIYVNGQQAFDSDVYVNVPAVPYGIGYAVFANAYFATSIIVSTGSAALLGPAYDGTGTGQTWGPASLVIEMGGRVYNQYPTWGQGSTWANTILLTGGITLNGQTYASAIPHEITNIPITPQNLDKYGTLYGDDGSILSNMTQSTTPYVLPYTPDASANWTGTIGSISAALDQLAARLAAHGY